MRGLAKVYQSQEGLQSFHESFRSASDSHELIATLTIKQKPEVWGWGVSSVGKAHAMPCMHEDLSSDLQDPHSQVDESAISVIVR